MLPVKTEMLRRNSLVSPESGRESIVRKFCERGRFGAGSDRERELWIVRVVG